MKKGKPKQRFRTLPKVDQYIVSARALADILSEARLEKGKKHVWTGFHVTVNQLKASLIEVDPVTGIQTQSKP